MKRILFFVHYNKYSCLADYVIYLLQHIKQIYQRIVFISNSPISGVDLEKLNHFGLYDDIILRENTGFDFGAWKDALLKEKWENLSLYDSVTLMNDTCFGPLFDLENVYHTIEQENINFWGFTDHQKHNGMPGTNGPIPEHIQSYFMCFNRNVIESAVFKNFWNNVINEKNWAVIIQKYETQLTPILKNNGYKYKSIFHSPYGIDAGNSRPDLCIRNSIPFIKIKSFLHNPLPDYLLRLIQKHTSYPISLITDHFTYNFDPTTSLPVSNKVLDIKCTELKSYDKNISSSINIAVHLHVFYFDIFEQYIAIFDKFSINFDLFITTDTIEKKEKIHGYLSSHLTNNKLKEVIIFNNHGRDIFPWLSIFGKLEKYDIVGHFHTKKSLAHGEYFLGMIWQEELFNLLLSPVDLIIKTFAGNTKIGIIIPDMPYIFQYPNILPCSYNKQLMNDLWEKMQCHKQIDFNKLASMIFSCGTIFWYRPPALKPLFRLNLAKQDIPDEPLPREGTILHCIEQLLVYVAWNEGYDYRISTNKTPPVNSFHYVSSINRFEDSLLSSKRFHKKIFKNINNREGIGIRFIINCMKAWIFRKKRFLEKD